MIEIHYKHLKSDKLTTLDKPKAGSWIYVEQPSHKELEVLADDLKLNYDLLRDGLDPYEVPRIESEDGNLYIFTRVPYNEGLLVGTAPILIVYTPLYLITITLKDITTFDKIFSDPTHAFTTQRTKLLLQVFTQINYAYDGIIYNVNRDIRKASTDVGVVDNQDIVNFVRNETIMNDFLSTLTRNDLILGNLLGKKQLSLYEPDKDLVEDLMLSNKQLIEICRMSLTMIMNIRDSHTVILTNNLNRIIKLFTSLTVLLTIPTIVGSFWGMNIPLPLATHPMALPIILFSTLALTITLLIIFIRKNWI